MSRGWKLVISILVAEAIFGLFVGSLWLYRNSGPVFTLGLPEAISRVGNASSMTREVRFPNVLPSQVSGTFEKEPLLDGGDLIEIDTRSSSVSVYEDTWSTPLVTPDGRILHRFIFQVYVREREPEDITESYFFCCAIMPLVTDLSLEGLGVVRMSVNGLRGAATHQKDDAGHWFVLREWYEAQVMD